MRTLITMLIAALTGIGGHFLNRRWDRALLFFGLVLLWGIGGGYLMTWYAFTHLSFDPPERLQEIFRIINGITIAGMGVLWVSSLVVTWRDAGKDRTMVQRWTVGGTIGAVLLTLICCGYAVSQGFSFYSTTVAVQTIPPDEGEAAFEALSDKGPEFWQYLGFGGLDDYDRELPPPPEGPGLLRGRFLYEGEPAPGVTLTVTLNGRYRSKELVTDPEGYFTLHVPPGEWFVNVIQTTAWKDKPAGKSFCLVSGHEDRLVDMKFERHSWFGRKGVRLLVGEESANEEMTLRIREEIDLAWPPGRGDDQASVADSVVEWAPYPGASGYLVEVAGLRREGRTTHYTDLARRKVSGNTRLALSAFTAADGGDAGKEYLVRVYAFAADGTFLSESGRFPEGAIFRLADGKQLVNEKATQVFGSSLSSEEIETLQKNGEYLDAVKVLIETDLLDAAGSLLQRVDEPSPPGRREVMTGYLMASRGECPQARSAFAEARKKEPEVCIPAEYYQGCSAE